MNYPIWDLPGRGLLIAGIAILHVFISHFAVGGGLFLVLTERRAYRTNDAPLLAWVKAHSKFFVLLTLVLGAITGVGIWFTIGLVHPDATAVLISAFVWAWAIEWTFFVAEIAAALVYYYGWDRLSPRAHLAVGWIYFANAWLSLVVINGILTFMLTPGRWVVTGNVLDGFFNPTYWPSLVARTLGACALAGIYALLTVSWHRDPELKSRMLRYAGLRWTLPSILLLPLAATWWLRAAAGAGVPVAGVFGVPSATVGSLLSAIAGAPDTGYPPVRAAALVFLAACTAVVLLLLVLAARPRWLRPAPAAVLMVAGLAGIGGAEWVREGMRKPWVIRHVMFSNGVRALDNEGAARLRVPAFDHAAAFYNVSRLRQSGVLTTSRFMAAPVAAHDDLDALLRDGEHVHRALCAACHTWDGYLALRPLVRGKSAATLEGLLPRLATAVDAEGKPAPWHDPAARLVTWRERQMPPFAGDARDGRALAVYMAAQGGTPAHELLAAPTGAGSVGRDYFDQNCAMCHGDEGQWPLKATAARSVDEYYELLGKLPSVNDMMPAFDGPDTVRRAVAEHLAALPRS